MNKISFLILILTSLIIVCDSSLEFGIIFFRHGERTAVNYLTFPTDPPISLDKIPYERGELTKDGMWQEYNLGDNLRSAYGKLLNYKYKPSQLRTYAGYDNRTLTSAMLALASFLPPVDEQIWNPSLLWQPIPVVTNSIIDHVSFGIMNDCPLLTKNIEHSKDYWDLFAQFTNVSMFLTQKTGLEIPNLNIFQRVLDAVINRKTLQKYVQLPDLVGNDKMMNYLKRLQLNMHIQFIQFTLNSLGVSFLGWHYDQILNAMENFVNNQTQHKIVLYSAHDTNTLLLNSLLGLNMSFDEMPNLASYLAFELHELNGRHVVKVFMHNNLNETAKEVSIANCKEPCFYEDFSNLGFRRFSNAEWLDVCLGTVTANYSFYETFTGIAIIAIVLLLICVLGFCCLCNSYKRKYQLISDSENQNLL